MQIVQGLDLFAGAGGLSLGAELAGIEVTHAYELNPHAAQTFRRNHPKTHLVEGDLRRSEPPRLKRGALTVLFGGPPCQGFSTSNQRTRSLDNPSNWLFREVLRFARIAATEWVVIENVKGLRETENGEFESMIVKGLHDVGYTSTVWTLCAADYGVPQVRSRVFVVGSRSGVTIGPPPPFRNAPTTVRDAIADLPELEVGDTRGVLPYRSGRASRYALSLRKGKKTTTGHLVTANCNTVVERYRHIPPGGNWTSIPKRLMGNYSNLVDNRSRHSGIYRRLVWDKPSVVIANYRKNMLVHPDQDRGLSVREAARIQSFPDSFHFEGSIGFQQQQVSNAVPPLLAKAVFQHILTNS